MKKITFVWLIASTAVFGADTNVVKVSTTNYVAAPSNFREVDGQLYDITRSIKWEPIRCKYKNQSGEFAVFRKVERVKTGEYEAHERANTGLGYYGEHISTIKRGIWEDREGEYILIKNFPTANLVTGQQLALRLLRVGQTNFYGSIVAIYDCSKPHLVPVVTSKAQLEAEKQKAAAAKKHATDAALKFNQDLAAKGDAYGLERMGERYRDGDGVEKDLTKAREYFEKAVAAGSPTAAAELSKLKP